MPTANPGGDLRNRVGQLVTTTQDRNGHDCFEHKKPAQDGSDRTIRRGRSVGYHFLMPPKLFI